MSTNDKIPVDDETRKKFEKLKESITEALGLSNTKLNELEKELQSFQYDLQSSNQVSITEEMNTSEQIVRLYTAERALTEILQQKIMQLESELVDAKTELKALSATNQLIEHFKGYLSQELAKFSASLQNPSITQPVEDVVPQGPENKEIGSIEGIISSENKAHKEERLRLQTENQELKTEVHFYQEKNDNFKKELQFRTQELNSLKKVMQEQERQEEEENDYLTKKSINDEYGFTPEEEFELTKEELNTLKGKYLMLEKENDETRNVIDNYKKELTDLKRILGDKNHEIKELKRSTLPPTDEQLIEEHKESEVQQPEIISQDQSRQLKLLQAEKEVLENRVKALELRNSELINETKRLEAKDADKELLTLQLESDKLTKAVYKIEKIMDVFPAGISTDAVTFERHVEVYSLLINKIYNARGYGLILDTLLKHKGKVLTKKMVMSESKTEPHITIRILRELHDSKIIHFDELNDQVIWR